MKSDYDMNINTS